MATWVFSLFSSVWEVAKKVLTETNSSSKNNKQNLKECILDFIAVFAIYFLNLYFPEIYIYKMLNAFLNPFRRYQFP